MLCILIYVYILISKKKLHHFQNHTIIPPRGGKGLNVYNAARVAYEFKNCSKVNNTSCMSEIVAMKCISKTYCVALKYLKAIISTFK